MDIENGKSIFLIGLVFYSVMKESLKIFKYEEVVNFIFGNFDVCLGKGKKEI